jgi:hypothetical protein
MRGHPPEQCGEPVWRIVQGEALCQNHAGQKALRILEAMN